MSDMIRDNLASPIPLEGSLQPLVEHFNTHKDRLRFLALLSPT